MKLRIGVIGLLFVALPGWAYVPPSEFIVKNLVAKRSGLKTIRIQNQLYALGSSGQAKALAKETLKLDFRRGTARSQISDLQGQTVHFRDEVPIGSLWKILLSPQSEEVAKGLMDSGVPIRSESELLKLSSEGDRRAAEISSIRRFRNKMAWMIGSDKTPGRLWVEKDVFLPLRWGKKMDSDFVEFFFDQFLTQKGIPYPKHIEISLGEDDPDSSLRMEVVEVQVNSEGKEAATTSVMEPSSELKDFLEKYYRLVQ